MDWSLQVTKLQASYQSVFCVGGVTRMNKKVKELGSAQIDEMFDLAAYAFNFEDMFERRERFQTVAEHSWNYGFSMKKNN